MYERFTINERVAVVRVTGTGKKIKSRKYTLGRARAYLETMMTTKRNRE